MKIHITSGIGEGTTKLAAFDSALFDAGIANFNLIYLSSVIPPQSMIIEKKLNWNSQHIGQRLYVVISRATVDIIGNTACAGLGWIYDKDSGGIFAEYTARCHNETDFYIKETLESMNSHRSINSSPEVRTIEVTCREKPICAIIAATYKIENWG